MPENTALQDAVEKADEELSKTNDGEETKTEESKTKETKSESDSEDKVDKRTLQALQLMDLLEDPKTGKSVVLNLVKQLGLDLDTAKEQKQAEKTIKSIVKEKLGPDFDILSDRLGEAIEEVINDREQRLQKVEQQKLAQAAEREYAAFITEHKLTDDEAGELVKLVDEMPWSGKGSLTGYLTRLLSFHRSEVSAKQAEIAKKQKQASNLTKTPKSLGMEANEDRVRKGSKTVSAREAVEAALRGETLE